MKPKKPLSVPKMNWKILTAGAVLFLLTCLILFLASCTWTGDEKDYNWLVKKSLNESIEINSGTEGYPPSPSQKS